jgi:hypothetical protein
MRLIELKYIKAEVGIQALSLVLEEKWLKEKDMTRVLKKELD